MSSISVTVAAISAYVVACLASQDPPVTLQGDNAQINYGLDFLARADTYPRIVACPADVPEKYGPADTVLQDMTNPANGQFTPITFDLGCLVDFHCWADKEDDCMGLVACICEAFKQIATGVAWPVMGFWPQIRPGKTYTAIAGREYVLRTVIHMPIVRANYPAISGVVGNITTVMDFADGTSIQDPQS